MESLLSVIYVGCVGAITRNLVQMKLQVDYEEELKQYREYDLSYEKIKTDVDNLSADGQFIILANLAAEKSAQ